MFHIGKSAVKGIEMLFQGCMGIDIERCSHLLCNGGQGNIFAIEFVFFVMKMMHGFLDRRFFDWLMKV